ncbi:primosomal protein N' [Staphylococcus capitis]|uniref:hypothetical protein n=1 Tax=Staphylococcus capitis TaxID=29388 RepID=UPI0011A2D66F|nr:hypothetical protein [Staphylococcus capitis]
MDIEDKGDEDVNMWKVKGIKEVEDIEGEVSGEVVELREWMSDYDVSKGICVVEGMLGSAIKGK